MGNVWTYSGLYFMDTTFWPKIEQEVKHTVEANPEIYGLPEDEPESWAAALEQRR